MQRLPFPELRDAPIARLGYANPNVQRKKRQEALEGKVQKPFPTQSPIVFTQSPCTRRPQLSTETEPIQVMRSSVSFSPSFSEFALPVQVPLGRLRQARNTVEVED